MLWSLVACIMSSDWVIIGSNTGLLAVQHQAITQSCQFYVPNFKSIWPNWMLQTQQPHDIDGLVQERRNSSAIAMELHLSCTNPWNWSLRNKVRWNPDHFFFQEDLKMSLAPAHPWDVASLLVNVEINFACWVFLLGNVLSYFISPLWLWFR